MSDIDAAAIPELEQKRTELLALRAELHRQRTQAPTPGIAHALRLADIYLFMALGYCAHDDTLFPEEGIVDEGIELPNLR